jgi:hypothetical protein
MAEPIASTATTNTSINKQAPKKPDDAALKKSIADIQSSIDGLKKQNVSAGSDQRGNSGQARWDGSSPIHLIHVPRALQIAHELACLQHTLTRTDKLSGRRMQFAKRSTSSPLLERALSVKNFSTS